MTGYSGGVDNNSLASFSGNENHQQQQQHQHQHQHQQAPSVGRKYGGMAPKKPLISKDTGRAFFDSADWALGMQGSGDTQKARTAVESLRPKLQRTPHQQLPPRRPTFASGKDNIADD